MAITFGTPTTATDDTGSAQSLTIAAPTMADGDVLIAFVSTQKSGSITQTWTPASGFTEIISNGEMTNNEQGAAFYKVVTDAAGEPADYTFSYDNSSGDMAGIIVAVSGVETSDPIEAVPASAFAASGSATATLPGLTTVNDGASYVGFVHQQRATSITFPVGFTSIGSVSSNNATVGNRATLAAAHKTIATAGVVADDTATSNQSRDNVGFSFALTPEDGGGEDPPPDPPTGIQAKIWDGAEFVLANQWVWDGSAWA